MKLKIHALTFPRFVAALAILVYHFGNELVPFSSTIFSPITQQLNVGVGFFYVLSGFVMVIAYRNTEWKGSERYKYWVNRFARVYPVYLAALLAIVLFYGLVGGNWNAKQIILGVLALQTWIPSEALSLNTPGWSISVEFFFYFTFPFLIQPMSRWSVGRVFVFTGVMWLLSQLGFLYGYIISYGDGVSSLLYRFLHYNPVMHLNEFVFGMAASRYFLEKKGRLIANRSWPIISLVLLVLVLMRFKPEMISFHNGLLAPIFALMLIWISVDTGWLARWMSHPKMEYLGEMSYAMYIIQLPVYKAWEIMVDKFHWTNPYWIFLGFLCLTLVLSMAAYKWLERPAKRMIKRALIKNG
jgi:peptidoglycan/LPS O-acetylase OafA/YrhL